MFNPPINPMLHGQKTPLQELREMHVEQLQALQRIEALLQQLLDARQATAARPDKKR